MSPEAVGDAVPLDIGTAVRGNGAACAATTARQPTIAAAATFNVVRAVGEGVNEAGMISSVMSAIAQREAYRQRRHRQV
jgi:hypothetical protein